MLLWTEMNRYFQKSSPQCTFCCPRLHKMKIDIENIVPKHIKFVACLSRLVLNSFCATCLNRKPEYSEYNNLQLQFNAIVMMVAFCTRQTRNIVYAFCQRVTIASSRGLNYSALLEFIILTSYQTVASTM